MNEHLITISGNCAPASMKRINPKTSKIFKRGDQENDQYFNSYDLSKKSNDGHFIEKWYQKFGKEQVKKRVNPRTGKFFKRGDVGSDGRVFKNYNYSAGFSEYCEEKWMSKEAYFRDCVRNKLRDSTRNRSRQAGFENLPHELSLDYLISIFPSDKRCPVFGFVMEFGGHRDSSPSLDRLNPERGYTKDNVVWISYLANRMKSNTSLTELVQIKDWAEKQ